MKVWNRSQVPLRVMGLVQGESPSLLQVSAIGFHAAANDHWSQGSTAARRSCLT